MLHCVALGASQGRFSGVSLMWSGCRAGLFPAALKGCSPCTAAVGGADLGAIRQPAVLARCCAAVAGFAVLQACAMSWLPADALERRAARPRAPWAPPGVPPAPGAALTPAAQALPGRTAARACSCGGGAVAGVNPGCRCLPPLPAAPESSAALARAPWGGAPGVPPMPDINVLAFPSPEPSIAVAYTGCRAVLLPGIFPSGTRAPAAPELAASSATRPCACAPPGSCRVLQPGAAEAVPHTGNKSHVCACAGSCACSVAPKEVPTGREGRSCRAWQDRPTASVLVLRALGSTTLGIEARPWAACAAARLVEPPTGKDERP